MNSGADQGGKPGASAYTGPTGFSLDQGRIHIEGYPDARKVVEWYSQIGHSLACLRLHQSSLKFCEDAMQEFGTIKDTRPLAAEAALIGIVARYFSCFGRNEASAPLRPDQIFHGMPEARECFDFWEDVRNNYLVHDKSELTMLRTGIVLGQSSEVLDIVSLAARPYLTSEKRWVQLLFDLIVHTQKKVAEKIDDLLKRAFAEANALSVEQREALAEIIYTVPDSGAAKRIRKARR